MGTERAGDYIFFFSGKGNENHQVGTALSLHHTIVSVVKKEFVSDIVSFIVLRGCWCNIFFKCACTK